MHNIPTTELAMKATPIIPGRAYSLTGCGLDLTVFASNPVDAITYGIELLISQGAE